MTAVHLRPGSADARMACWTAGGCSYDAGRLPGGAVLLLCDVCSTVVLVPADAEPAFEEAPAPDDDAVTVLGTRRGARSAIALVAAARAAGTAPWLHTAERDRALTRPTGLVDGLLALAVVALSMAAAERGTSPEQLLAGIALDVETMS